jgi:hypothetical protein
MELFCYCSSLCDLTHWYRFFQEKRIVIHLLKIVHIVMEPLFGRSLLLVCVKSVHFVLLHSLFPSGLFEHNLLYFSHALYNVVQSSLFQLVIITVPDIQIIKSCFDFSVLLLVHFLGSEYWLYLGNLIKEIIINWACGVTVRYGSWYTEGPWYPLLIGFLKMQWIRKQWIPNKTLACYKW